MSYNDNRKLSQIIHQSHMADQAPQQPAHEPAPQAPPKPSSGASAADNKLMAAFSYIGILFLIPLLTEAKNDDYVKFHVRQGIVLFVIDVVGSFIAWVPFIGWAIGLVLLVVSVYGFVQAYEGRRWELPYVAKYARQIKI